MKSGKQISDPFTLLYPIITFITIFLIRNLNTFTIYCEYRHWVKNVTYNSVNLNQTKQLLIICLIFFCSQIYFSSLKSEQTLFLFITKKNVYLNLFKLLNSTFIKISNIFNIHEKNRCGTFFFFFWI